MRTRLVSVSMSHSVDSFSLSLILCRAQSVTHSVSRPVCLTQSVSLNLPLNLCRNQSVSLVLSRLVLSLCRVALLSLILSRQTCCKSAAAHTATHNQLITSQPANHKSISHKSVNHSNPLPHQFLLSSHTVSWPINHAPVYPISTCLSYLSYCTQSIIIDSLYNDPSVK